MAVSYVSAQRVPVRCGFPDLDEIIAHSNPTSSMSPVFRMGHDSFHVWHIWRMTPMLARDNAPMLNSNGRDARLEGVILLSIQETTHIHVAT